MSKYNNFYTKDPFGVFKVEPSIQMISGDSLAKSTKPPVVKIILVVLLIIGIAVAFFCKDIIKKFFLDNIIQSKPTEPKDATNEKDIDREMVIQKTTKPKTETSEEGTGATIIE